MCASHMLLFISFIIPLFSRRITKTVEHWTVVVPLLGLIYCIFNINKQLILNLILDIDGYCTDFLIRFTECLLSEGTVVSFQMQSSINQPRHMSLKPHNYEQIIWVYRDCCCALQEFATWHLTFSITNHLKTSFNQYINMFLATPFLFILHSGQAIGLRRTALVLFLHPNKNNINFVIKMSLKHCR